MDWLRLILIVMAISMVLILIGMVGNSFFSIRHEVSRKGMIYIMVPVAVFFLVGSLIGIGDVLFFTGVFSITRCCFAGLSAVLVRHGFGYREQSPEISNWK